MIELIAQLPQAIKTPIVLVVLGALVILGGDMRWVQASDYTKNYVLNLKREIREIRKEIGDAETDSERDTLQEQLDVLLDELCYEVPDDPYCKGR